MVKRFSRQELAIQRAKKYLRSQGIMNKKDEEKMPDRIRKKMEEILKLDNGGTVDKPKSKLLIKKPKVKKVQPYIDFGKTREFAKNEKSGAVIKQDTAKLGANIGKNLNLGLTYDKNKYSKKNFTQKTTKKGVEAGLYGRKGSVNIQVGKQSMSNPFEGRSTGKYFNVQGRINLPTFSAIF